MWEVMAAGGGGWGEGSQLSSPGICPVEGSLTRCQGNTSEESLVLSGPQRSPLGWGSNKSNNNSEESIHFMVLL